VGSERVELAARPQGRKDGRRFLLAEMPASQSLMKTEIYGMNFDLTGLDGRFLARAKRPLAGDRRQDEIFYLNWL